MMKKMLAAGVMAILAVTCAGAVHAQATPASDAAGAGAHASRPPGIDWFDGDVTDALRHAQEAKRPVFLYWGALWCPPCQELKATIFLRRDFRDQLKLFVAVYLDGDAAGAQAWGERFHISGYPTVLVLDANGSELERVSGGMDLGRYAEVLQLALGQQQPVQEILAAGDAADAPPAAADDCRRLAYNAWGLDEAWTQHPEGLGALAARLAHAAQRCPAGLDVERARLQLTAVRAAVVAEREDLSHDRAPSAALAALLAPVPQVLADRSVAPAIGDALWYMPQEFFRAAATFYDAPAEGKAAAPDSAAAGRRALRERWFALMDRLAADRRYSAADRLDALRSKLVAAKALSADGKVPPALAADATRRIDQDLAREHEPHARSSLVNSALNALDVIGDDARAHAILSGEIATSQYAYYYMADLGELEEKLGHKEAAIDWLGRSFRNAQGPATRFQWGVGYVRGLVRMTPQDDAAIQKAALQVLAELDAANDLHGRTLRSLLRLDASLRDWGRDARHAAALEAIRARLQPVCGRLAPDDGARPACTRFLAPEGGRSA